MYDYSRDPCYPELIAVAIVGAMHVITELAFSPFAAGVYNGIASVGFLGYLIWRGVRTKHIFRIWGIRADNFSPALKAQLLFGIPVAVLLCGFGLYVGTVPLPRTFWLIFGLYPIWGITQQFAVQNLIAKNLKNALPSPLLHALATAGLFSAPHYPNAPLMILVLFGGFFFTLLYQRNQNLWAVGIVHGFLGAMAYYIVLREDPGAAIIGFLK